MYPSEIEGYVAPCTVQEATEAFAKWGEETHYIAGGQSLMQAVKSRMIRPRCLVDLQKIVSIRGLHEDGSGRRIGAMTRYCDIASSRRLGGAFAALVDAASHVGDRQVLVVFAVDLDHRRLRVLDVRNFGFDGREYGFATAEQSAAVCAGTTSPRACR